MSILADCNLEEIKCIVKDIGEPLFRAKQLYSAIYDGKKLSEATNIPKGLIEKIGQDTIGGKIVDKLVSKDKTIKYLMQLEDNNIIECVVMNYKHGNTICISTQVGCRMNCDFCASGIDGLIRNLTAGEMVSQVVIANRDLGGTAKNRLITNIVLMGSGEPLDNYDNVIKFLRLISDSNSINISPRNISLSTCGLVDKMKDLANEGITVNLTLSLHAPFDEIRDKIMPINKAYKISNAINALKYYFEKTKRRVIIEYSLIDGINDSNECAEELSRLVKGFPCHVNIIRLNNVTEKKYKPSKKQNEFLKILEENNVSVTLRRIMGADIEGACGQLRRRYLNG